MSTTRFVFFTDPHLRGNNPISRKDNFPETAFRKIQWVVDFANSEDAALICGGDWVHRPDTAPHVLAKLQSILKQAQNPVFSVIGNHDIYGYNPGTFFRTPLSIVEGGDVIRRLSAEPTIWRDVQLTGVDAHYDLDHNGRTIDYTEIAPHPGKVAIHVVHGFLVDHEWPQVPCTTLDRVQHTQADIVLTGHEHAGFGVRTADTGPIFCNPGSLLRVTAGVGDINQLVKVALITVDTTTQERSVSLVPLPSDIALPADEVLDRARLLEEKRVEQVMTLFTDDLGSFTLQPGKTAFELLDIYMQDEHLADNLVAALRARLTQADLELATLRSKEARG